MLYILPPPSAPSPPSPWTTIMCAGGSGGGGANYKGSATKSKTVTRSASWVTVNNGSSKRPPSAGRAHLLKNRSKSRDSGAGGLLEDDEAARNSRSLSECYFAGKGAALVLPPNERLRPCSRRVSASAGSGGGGSDIQQHLQSMFYLLRPEETLKMAVKLESIHSGRTRYLVVVSCLGRQDAEESCLLGIDCNEKATVGLVLRVLADTAIRLDGDGGFSVSVCGRQHIFKPVSVQAMWSALQTLHKVSSKARDQNYFLGGLTHDWVDYYERRIESDRSCLNEWHAMDSIESRRPPSPDSVRTKPLEREETERVIRCTLKEIMMSVDLDEVTSKYIRGRLEEDLDVDLVEFKPFIDQEMLTILGQMDAATEIFDHVYLGSEWNASNLEELQKHGVRHILNVTREIDNFFPGMFNYLNVRVYDDEKTDLLKHWDNTFKYISRAKKEGSKVLVHCKMGVSRSASVVIAYAMKAYNWDFKRASEYVKQKRSCIKPNTSFISQLETYQGILDAMKNREKLQRSKSETNLKSPGLVAKAEQRGGGPAAEMRGDERSCERLLGADWAAAAAQSGQDLSRLGGRPKSWSPDNAAATVLLMNGLAAPTSMSLEQLNPERHDAGHKIDLSPLPEPPGSPVNGDDDPSHHQGALPAAPVGAGGNGGGEGRNYNLNVRMPCKNGQAYSVSQNKVVYLPASCDRQLVDGLSPTTEAKVVPSVKHRVIELESQNSAAANGRKSVLDRKGLVLNLTSQFENTSAKPDSPGAADADCCAALVSEEEVVCLQTQLGPQMLTAVLVKKEIWDPGEKESPTTCQVTIPSSVGNSDVPVWTSAPQAQDKELFVSELRVDSGGDIRDSISAVPAGSESGTRVVARKEGDPFSAQLDRVFDREERKQKVEPALATTLMAPLALAPITALPSVTEVPPGGEITCRDCPSRQSSWSSYDSAVVLGYQGEPRGDVPSRQSSWGSADTRCTYGGGTLPSRNSSWGSYDMRPPMQHVAERGEKPPTQDDFGSSSSGMFPYDRDEIPWYPGTVKRTKQKLEEGKCPVKRASTDVGPSAGDTSPNKCPSPHKTGDVTVNLRLHGPRPYQSPTAVSSLGFAFPCSRVPCLPADKTTELPFETLNPILTHYASSPTLSTQPETVTIKKMASSQPNITLNSTLASDNNPVQQSRAILTEASFKSFLPESSKTLSVSAPTPSSLGLIGNSIPSARQPSTSLHAMTLVGTSSPCIINTTQCASVKQQKKILENLAVVINRCLSVEEATEATKDDLSLTRTADGEAQKSVSGLVRNLKKEFEAKSSKADKAIAAGDNCAYDNDKRGDSIKVKSLPSSPIAVHPDQLSADPLSPSATAEDLSVKVLVGKYEVGKGPARVGSQINGRTRLTSENETVHRRVNSQKSSLPQRKSSLDVASLRNNAQPQPVIKNSLLVHNLKNGANTTHRRTIEVSNGDDFRRPPVPPAVKTLGPSPSVVVATVVAKAASKKQQQGKTHPLARLTIKPRHNNPVYNTM